jgi:cell division protein FtsI (penicillin-binding protein 3)
MFKVITLTAALETTDLRPDSLIPTGNGTLVLPGRVIHESHGGYGTITMADVLEKSSNIGAIMIGTRWAGRTCTSTRAARLRAEERACRCRPNRRAKLRPLNRWGTTSLASIRWARK